MCGRFTLRTPHTKLLEQFGAAPAARFNIAPTQPVLVVRGGQRELVQMSFGLVTSQGLMINARSETVATKPTFRESFKRRRCLAPADGFYEWRKPDKQPFFISMKDGEPFAFAAIWQDDQFAILTTGPNELLEPLHDRMPVILEEADYDRWLNESTPLDDLPPLAPYAAERMQAIAVSPRVNNIRNDDAKCLTPAASQQMLF